MTQNISATLFAGANTFYPALVGVQPYCAVVEVTPNCPDVVVNAGENTCLQYEGMFAEGTDLINGKIFWSLFAMSGGSVVVTAILRKTLGSGIEIQDDSGEDAQDFTVSLLGSDTQNLLGNYFYEIRAQDVVTNRRQMCVGLLTVLMTATTDYSDV